MRDSGDGGDGARRQEGYPGKCRYFRSYSRNLMISGLMYSSVWIWCRDGNDGGSR
ncbi:hypothetical protein Hanom_Chr12g01110451 [Helianthus anomalus]